MRTLALGSLLTAILLAFAGCASKQDAPTTSSPTTSAAPEVRKDATIITSGEVTRDRNLRVSLVQDGNEVGSQAFSVPASEKNVKRTLFTQSVVAKDLQVRVFDGSNPAGTDKVEPQTCTGNTVEVDIHALDDTVHITWKCT